LHREIAEALSERIVSGELGPGVLLPPERELCESFGVSRTVIREAIKLLESRGLVRIERGRGTVVQEARHEAVSDSLRLMLRRNPHTIEELLELRKILEAGIAALAAERRTDDNMAAMQRCLETMRQKPGEPEGYVDADLGFHAEVARAAQNPLLLLVLNPLAELLRQSRIATFSGPRFVKLRTKQHEAIFEMIRKKDPEGARAMMLWHLSDTQKDLERHRKKS
jgi:GntR family transcriptional repressor for pyruvate dehydrogenase complex